MRERPEGSPPLEACDGTDDEALAVEVPIEDAIDLHVFAPRDVAKVVQGYLEAALERGFGEVRLIHGKGKGVRRAEVQRILASHPDVIEFFDGTAQRGGWGATVVRLRSAASTRPAKSREP